MINYNARFLSAKFNILKDEVDNLAKHLFKHDINKRIQENTGENNMDIISKQRNIKNKKNLNVAYNQIEYNVISILKIIIHIYKINKV